MLRNRKSSFWMCSLRPDVIAKERPLSYDDKLRKVEIIRELNRITPLETEIKGTFSERENASFFHRMANFNRRNNSIESLEVNGLSFLQFFHTTGFELST